MLKVDVVWGGGVLLKEMCNKRGGGVYLIGWIYLRLVLIEDMGNNIN